MKHALVVIAALFALSTFLPPRQAATVDGPVAQALKSASPTDRARVAGLYRALADVTARDGGRLITTTAEWRALHSNALRLGVGGTDLVGRYPGLDKAVEEVLGQHVSLEVLPLAGGVGDKLVAGCRAVERQSE
jgi:hypothetical protein